MKAILLYLLQVIIISGLLYSYYHFFLRNNRFHQYNRLYLLLSSLLSLVVPFLNIPLYFTKADQESFVISTLSSLSFDETEAVVITATANTSPGSSWFSWSNAGWLLYGGVVLIIFLRILFSLAKIRRLKKMNPSQLLGKIHFVSTEEPNTPFSFFRWLFWNKNIELQSPKGEQLFRHELYHIEQKHSYDVIYMELLYAICWINPFFYLMRKELKAIHEFLADRFAIRENEKWQYAELLLMQAFHTRQPLVNPFFNTQIKRRIAMITTSNKPSYQYLRKIMVLPLILLTFALFAFKYGNKNEKLPRPITVIIDAGHGGDDRGAVGADGSVEKDIVLSMAQMVRDLNSDDNIRIILTRNSDMAPSLASRSAFVEKNKADLFISLHVNTAMQPTETKSGVEISISGKNKTFDAENKLLASILLDRFSGLYSTKMDVVRQAKGTYVLDNATCPSVLIECGYLSNSKDIAFITNKDNQEKIAETVLKAIRQYALQQDKPLTLQQNSLPGTQDNPGPVSGNSSADLVKLSLRQESENVLIIVDGVAQPGLAVKSIDELVTPDEIYSVNVLKGQSALDLYGEKGKNGVVEIRTKKGYLTENSNIQLKELRPGIDTTTPLVKFEPKFPGGASKWNEYVQRNIKATLPVDSGAPAGSYTVIVQFIVQKDGKVSDIAPLTDHGFGMEKEVVRLIRNGPNWEPVTINGKYVKAYKKQPVTFVVSEDHDDQQTATVKTGPDPLYQNDKSKVFEKVETDARFPGGEEKWKQYLTRNFNANIPAQQKAPDGAYTAVIMFIVDKDGNISDIRPMTKHGYGIEEEAMRLIRKGPRWSPAIMNGKPVNSYKKQPVTFIVGKGEKNFRPVQEPATGKYPRISIASLQKATPHALLQLPANIEILYYKFTIDDDKGDITEIPNQGTEFASATRRQITTATAGKLITIDMIRVKVDGEEKKLPSLVYEVVN
jgi:N-acetylmuramoyl-L-alanine amidase